MVYAIFNESFNGTIGRKPTNSNAKSQINLQNGSLPARIVIIFVKILLLIYDIISFPVYFAIQRPDRRAKEALRTRSERVDINTWIKTDQIPNGTCYQLHGSYPGSQDLKSLAHKYMGSTLSEIFANALRDFSSRPCLGYRAVVTCPVMTINEEGEHVIVDKSFRSDYTWYTYEQIGRRVQDIASGLYHYSVYPGSRALFLASTSLEWFCASQACFQLKVQIVLCPEINDTNTLKLIIKEAEVDIIFTSCDRLSQLCQLLISMRLDESENAYSVKKIVLIDWLFPVDFSEPAFAELRDSSKFFIDKLLSMGQVEEAGVENPIELSCTKALDQTVISQDNLRSGINVSPDKQEYNQTSNQFNLNAQVRTRSSSVGSFKSYYNTITNAKDSSQTNSIAEDKAKYVALRKYQLDSCKKAFSPRANHTRKVASETIVKPADLAMIVYTYGTIGQIKGVMLTHSYLARSNHYLFLDSMVDEKDIHCTTLSLDNVIEFMTEMCIFSQGGSIGYSSNSNTLFYDGKALFKRDLSDLEALSPTFLLVKPYILERLRVSVQDYLSLRLNPLLSFILTNIFYDYKKFWFRRHFGTPIGDHIFISELKRLFGSKLKYILCNGATDCSETKDFFAFMLNIPVIELYGPDEAIVSLMSVNDVWDYKRRKLNSWHDEEADEEEMKDYQDMQLMPPKVNKNIFRLDSSKNLLITSSILCPTLCSRIRLEDWEDFRTSDQPYPRGRLVIGGDVISKGYHKRPDLTSKSFYTDSNFITWFRTDDIARVFPNGSFEIISGMSDMVKMVDGQFISLSQIEHILRNSQFVENVCAICGDDRKFVIALVVPNLRRLALKSPGEADLKMAIGTEPEPEELLDLDFRREVCNDRLLCEFVNEHLSELIAKAGFQSIPKRFHLVPEIWTPDTELVTPAFEPKRNSIQKFYATDIQSIFMTEFSLTRERLSTRRLRLGKNQPNFSRMNQSNLTVGSRLSY